MTNRNSFDCVDDLNVDGKTYRYFSLPKAEANGLNRLSRLPFSLKVLAENLLRHEDGVAASTDDLQAMADWSTPKRAERDIAYFPSRVVMPDSSGIPLLADFAAMRDAMKRLGGDPADINPAINIDFIVDHSVIVDHAGSADALDRNMALEFQRNEERYAFLRWAQDAFRRLRVIPPGAGIIHQVNLEHLARVVWTEERDGVAYAFPDCVLGMDSHTPMINGIGILGWGCGGIEAGATILGEPISMRLPDVIGVRLTGSLREGVTTTDLVLTITQILRAKGVVQKFVEFWGDGAASLTLPDRATIANMAPEYGATVGYFPIDAETLDYLRATGRTDLVPLVEAYAKAQGMWRDETTPEPEFTDIVEIDLTGIESSMAGPHRPHDRVALSKVGESANAALPIENRTKRVPVQGKPFSLGHGDLVLAAITSCTNTSNPSVMLAAGLLAKKAMDRGLTAKPWVKTSLAPGSRVVADYLQATGLQDALDALGFHVVGFGCTTCMGNSGPLDQAITRAIDDEDLAVGAALSGNRNFEGRIHPKCRLNYIGSPPLVVAYAIAGNLSINLMEDPLGDDANGQPVYLRDVWPTQQEVEALTRTAIGPDLYERRYADVFAGDEKWQALPVRGGTTFDWAPSDYIRQPPFFNETEATLDPVEDLIGARPLVIVGDSITTDHISPVASIDPKGPAGRFLIENGIAEKDFNSYAARRVNHDVMIRGTFANARFRNELADGREGSFTRHMPSNDLMTVYDAAMRYKQEDVPLVIVAGQDYGAGSSRDWAAKGTRLLGVHAVIAEGLERIHRANLVGMGVLPLQFKAGENRETLALDGTETVDLPHLADHLQPHGDIPCRITYADGRVRDIALVCRLDTAYEVDYYRNGGILHYVLRNFLNAA